MMPFSDAKKTMQVGSQTYTYYSLQALIDAGMTTVSQLPCSLKVLLENLLRRCDGQQVQEDDVRELAAWPFKKTSAQKTSEREIAFQPARVLMQDFTGVPAVVDLAAMRDALAKAGHEPQKVNPLSPVDLVIDHSVMVDYSGSENAFDQNVSLEYQRNMERYAFLRWGQKAFHNFRVVPPGTGICHQVNLECLAKVVWTSETGEIYPDTVVGTDSHTTMINGLSVLGWGVGGIEAEAAMLGQPISMLIPEVVGFKLTGQLTEGTTATDLVLTVTQMLRAKNVVGKFVEFYGEGVKQLSLADRATIANMAPEYGATCGFFPVDEESLSYLRLTGREEAQIQLVEAYAKAQGLWLDVSNEPVFTDTLSLDMGTVEASLAGPKRPQDRVTLSQVPASYLQTLQESQDDVHKESVLEGVSYRLKQGDVVIAAITSCTNTSNPSVMLGAGLLARKAVAKGLKTQPWVKTSLAPGSQVVTDYLNAAGVQRDLDKLGFQVVGYGCTTCIGNSGPLSPHIVQGIQKEDLNVCAVLSGNRNFEGRVNPHVKSNYLASPLLVVAYALAGSLSVNLLTDPLGTDFSGESVYLKDIWPSQAEIKAALSEALSQEMFQSRYSNVFQGDEIWQGIEASDAETYSWNTHSTYVQSPPYFSEAMVASQTTGDIQGARPLAILGDSITTDHISPAGSIKADGPAGLYLKANGVDLKDFNSYGARRGNHEVMIRGTFANIRLKNEMVPGVSGGVTKLMPAGVDMSIYDAAEAYQADGTPLVVIAGKEYGTGSSRDWAAKGTRLLGVKAVIAESFERIHRSNLVGMGVLPLLFPAGVTRSSLGLDGSEKFDLMGLSEIFPQMTVSLVIHRLSGNSETVPLLCRIDTWDEVAYFKAGGILPYVAGKLMSV